MLIRIRKVNIFLSLCASMSASWPQLIRIQMHSFGWMFSTKWNSVCLRNNLSIMCRSLYTIVFCSACKLSTLHTNRTSMSTYLVRLVVTQTRLRRKWPNGTTLNAVSKCVSYIPVVAYLVLTVKNTNVNYAFTVVWLGGSVVLLFNPLRVCACSNQLNFTSYWKMRGLVLVLQLANCMTIINSCLMVITMKCFSYSNLICRMMMYLPVTMFAKVLQCWKIIKLWETHL